MVIIPKLEEPLTLRYLYALFSFKSSLKLWGQGYSKLLTVWWFLGKKKTPMFTESLFNVECWARFFAYILLHLLTTTTLWGSYSYLKFTAEETKMWRV